MRKGFILSLVAAVWVLGVAAPQTWAAFPKDSSQEAVADLQATLMAMHHLSAHPEVVGKLSPEKIYWLLEGFERLARVPFVDHDALFRLQVRLTLALLDLQVAKLNKVFGIRPQPMPFEPVMDAKGRRETMTPERDEKRQFLHHPFVLPPWGIEKIASFRFYTTVGCQLHQAKLVRQNAWKREIFVGPCQAADDGLYRFNVWRVQR